MRKIELTPQEEFDSMADLVYANSKADHTQINFSDSANRRRNTDAKDRNGSQIEHNSTAWSGDTFASETRRGSGGDDSRQACRFSVPRPNRISISARNSSTWLPDCFEVYEVEARLWDFLDLHGLIGRLGEGRKKFYDWI